MNVYAPIIENSIEIILNDIDPQPKREGLKNTPKRYAKFLQQFLNPPTFDFTVFKNESDNAGYC
jgi:GTP cyclohydrolase I